MKRAIVFAMSAALSICLFGCDGKEAEFQEEYGQTLASIAQMNADIY